MLRYLNNYTRPKARPRELIIKTLVDSRGFYGLLILAEIDNLSMPSPRGSRIYKEDSSLVEEGFLKCYLLSQL